MKNVSVTFTFDQLSETAKSKALNDFRETVFISSDEVTDLELEEYFLFNGDLFSIGGTYLPDEN